MTTPNASRTSNPPPPAVQVHGWWGCALTLGVVAVSMGAGVLIGLVLR